jgi:hypothetical protein
MIITFFDEEEKQKVKLKMKELKISCSDQKKNPPKKEAPKKNPPKKEAPKTTKKEQSKEISRPTKKLPSKEIRTSNNLPTKSPKNSTKNKNTRQKEDFLMPHFKEMTILQSLYGSQMERIKELLTQKSRNEKSNSFLNQFLLFYKSFQSNIAQEMALNSRKLAEAFFSDLESISGHQIESKMSLGKKINLLRDLLKGGLFKENSDKSTLMWRSLCFLDQIRILGNEHLHYNSSPVKKKKIFFIL